MAAAFVLPTPNPIHAWSAFVIAIPFWAILRMIRDFQDHTPLLLCGAFAAAAVTTTTVLRFHIAWLTDPRLQTPGSSTAALGFLFEPIKALFFGGVAFAIVALMALAAHAVLNRRD